MSPYDEFNLPAPGDFVARSYWSDWAPRYGNSSPTHGVWLHHTVVGDGRTGIDPVPPVKPKAVRVLWKGQAKPNKFGMYRIFAAAWVRYGVRKWVELDVRQRGGDLGWVVVQVDPELEALYRGRKLEWVETVKSTVEREKKEMRKLETIGNQRFGRGVSYSEVLFESGRSYGGCQRAPEQFNQGTHTMGYNNCHAIALHGNYSERQLTHGQRYYIKQRVRELNPPYVSPHRRSYATQCPGNNTMSTVPGIIPTYWKE